MRTGLSGRTVLIVDGDGVAAPAMVRAFASEGATLVVGRLESHGDGSVRREEVGGVSVLLGSWDVRDESSIRALLSYAAAETGPVDVLVNNPSVTPGSSTFAELSHEEWSTTLAIGLSGPLFVAKHVLPGMIENRWGRIITFAGLPAFYGTHAAVSATQLGVVGLTRGIARFFGDSNVTANCVAPGGVLSEAGAGASDFAPTATDPVPRWGLPEEVASLVVYLASDSAAYLTGQCLLVNGGKFLL